MDSTGMVGRLKFARFVHFPDTLENVFFIVCRIVMRV